MHLKSIVLILLTSVVAAENGICYLKDLQKAENIAPVTPNITLSDDHLNVTCEEGYTTRTAIPLCIDGKWYRNSASPCKEMTCKPPPKVANAVQELRYRLGVVIYRCKEPYILEGPSQVECRFGEWRGQLPICTDKNCTDAPLNVTHATVEIISTPQTKLAKYVCKEPYLLVGNSELRCFLGEWNGTAPMCTDSRCYLNDLQTEENLAEGTPMITNSGEKLNATCKVGYTLDEERPMCQNGTWIKNSFSICKESTCSIPNIDHGKVLEEYKEEYYLNLTKLQYDRNSMHIKMPIGRIVSPGTSYTLLCDKGYVVQGKSVNKSDISCKAGMWLPEPACVFETECRKLNETNLLSIYYTDDRKIGSFAIFDCLCPGKRIGEPFARCLGNGLWSKSVPTCESRCDINDLHQSSHISREETPRFTNSGQNLDVTCKEGYSPRHVTPYCFLDGEWEQNSRSPCKENDCSVPEIEHGNIFEKVDGSYNWDFGKFRHVQEVNYTIVPYATLVAPSTGYHLRCDSGYSFQGAPETERRITCTKGNWLPAPVCIPRRCDINDLRNSSHISREETPRFTNSGRFLDVTCKEGYSPRHVTPYCLNGKWGYSIPIRYSLPISPCKESRCDINDLRNSSHISREETPRFTNSGQYLDVTCKEGYSPRHWTPYCLNGKWGYSRTIRYSLPISPCKESIKPCILGEKTSQVLVDPVKDQYIFGESITLSCPPLQKLSSNVQRVMCLGTSWSDPIPDCVK